MLRFDLGPIPVSVHFSFLFILWIAYSITGDLVDAGVAGIGIFAGILLHESGHAVTARRFGARNVRITLFALGGVTTYPPPKDLTAGRRFLIAAAGSAVGIAVGLPVFLVERSAAIGDETLRLIAVGFWVAALFWGVLNWVPIRPLDGGHMLTSALQIIMDPRRAVIIAKVISVAFTAAAVIWLLQNDQRLGALYVGFIGLMGLRDEPTATAEPKKQEEPAPEDAAPTEQEPPPQFPL